MTSATDTARRNVGGRPRVGDQVKIAFPAHLLAEIDRAAHQAGISRAEWVRRACLLAL